MTELWAIKPSCTARASWLMLMSTLYVGAALSIFCIVMAEVLSARADERSILTFDSLLGHLTLWGVARRAAC